jgi:hypothetical protein
MMCLPVYLIAAARPANEYGCGKMQTRSAHTHTWPGSTFACAFALTCALVQEPDHGCYVLAAERYLGRRELEQRRRRWCGSAR